MAITTDVCYHFGVKPEEHGIGWSGNSGADWPFPVSRAGVLELIDDNEISRLLVLDANDGKFWDISVREGADNSGLSRIVRDKVLLSDSTNLETGSNISPYFETREDRGSFEHYYLVHKRTHIYLRPYDITKNSDTDHYDSNGYLDGMLVDINLYIDGERTTASATMDDIDPDGELFADKVVRANRVRTKFSANRGDHVITGFQTYYISQDQPPPPANNVSTEMDNQEAFSDTVIWLSLINGTLYDRVTAAEVTATFTAVTSPDGNTDAQRITSAITTDSISASGDSLVVWHTAAITVTIGGDAIALTTYNTSGGFTLSYATGITKSGAVVITPATSADIFDFRIVNTALTATNLAYYFDDIVNNSGNIMICR